MTEKVHLLYAEWGEENVAVYRYPAQAEEELEKLEARSPHRGNGIEALDFFE